MSRTAVLTVVSIVLTLGIAAAGILLLSNPDSSAFWPGILALVIAVLPVTVVRFAFRGTPSLLALRILAITEFGLGFVGAAVGLIAAAVTGSLLGVWAGLILFAAGLVASVVGAIVYREVERGVSPT